MTKTKLPSGAAAIEVNLLKKLHLRIMRLRIFTFSFISISCSINRSSSTFRSSNIYKTKLCRDRCCNGDFATLYGIFSVNVKIDLIINAAYNMAAFNFCFKDISIVTVVVESYRIKNSNLFLVTVFNSQFMFFKNKDKKISRVLTTKTNAGITPFGSKHTDTCSYSIITPESVAACKHRKSPVGLIIADTHLLHKMFSIIFRNNPGSTLTVISVVAYRVMPFTIISGIVDKMILTHCRMILIIREFTNGKIREIFIK